MRALLAAALFALGGCTVGATEVLVRVDTDLPHDATLSLRATVRSGNAIPMAGTPADRTWSSDGGLVLAIPASFAVVPAPGVSLDTPVVLIVEAQHGGTTLRRIARFSFQQHQTTTLRVFLASICAQTDAQCSGTPCSRQAACEAMGESCDESGQCTPLDVHPGSAGDGGDVHAALDVGSDVPCEGAACGCPPGQHLCGATCVASSSVASCGSACMACPAPANGTATCDGTRCGVSCNAGFGDCDGNPANGCEADLSQAPHCGSCTTSCSGAAPLCQRTGSSFMCVSGCGGSMPTMCGASCTNLATDASNCGSCGHVCTAPASGSATCAGGVCGFACNSGFHACSGACVSDSSPAHCGSSCSPCGAPANASATCAAGACGFACNAGFTDCGGACVDTGTDGNHCGSCGNACLSHACQGGNCAGFGGLYADSSTACVYCNNDPLSGGCGCPSGTYPARQSFLTMNDCGATHNPAVTYLCTSNPLDASAFGGAYEVDDAVGCGMGCLANNPYTGACSCPAGTASTWVRVVHNTTCGTIGARIYFCNPPSPTSSYGGVYERDDAVSGGLGCRSANTYTGGCSCPAGYSASAIRVLVDITGAIIGSNLYQCTR